MTNDPNRGASRPARGRPVPGEAGDRGPGSDDRADVHLPAGPGALPDRGRARPGQDPHGLDPGAKVVGGDFSRIQFTPDLVPADIIGTRIWRPSREEFDIEWGPVFANIVLADEINRAPAKVQAALLEVMAEGHVSIGGSIRAVDEPFLVAGYPEPDRIRRRVLASGSAARPVPDAGGRRAPVVRGGDWRSPGGCSPVAPRWSRS